MYLIAIAWIYVALMMAVAEATHANGTVLGAIVTFFLYGVGPMALVMYLLGSPVRRRARQAAEAAADAALAIDAADALPDGRAGDAATAGDGPGPVDPSAAGVLSGEADRLDPDRGGHAAALSAGVASAAATDDPVTPVRKEA